MLEGAQKKLVFENAHGQVVRHFHWTGSSAEVVRRKDNGRLEIVKDFSDLERRKIAFQKISHIERSALLQQPLVIGALGHLKLVDALTELQTDPSENESSKKTWHASLLLAFCAGALMVTVVRQAPKDAASLQTELKQEIVKIAKTIPKPQAKQAQNLSVSNPENQTVEKKQNAILKRSGVLSALGSLQKSNQKGGLNLGATQTTAGPGLGGTQGSGGVQTSIYSQGLVAAPLGAGGKVEGGGGYGTKGKGGGQAGYGSLSLAGSVSTMPIALPEEVAVETGLDKDQIAAVIQKNLGQVRFCYEQGLQIESSLNGRVSVDFTVSPQGKVSRAVVQNTTLNAKAVEECIMMRLKTWTFPLPRGGAEVKVTYPFILRRAGK